MWFIKINSLKLAFNLLVKQILFALGQHLITSLGLVQRSFLQKFPSIKILSSLFYSSKQYYLTLDGYYYCLQKKGYYLVFHVRHKRSVEVRLLRELIKDDEFLSSLHPYDGFIIGVMANKESNDIKDLQHTTLSNMQKIKHFYLRDKIEPLIEINRCYTNQEGNRIIVLKLKAFENLRPINLDELARKFNIIYALSALDALSLGFQTGERILYS